MTRLNALLRVAQRDAAMHKQAAHDAAAIAQQRVREARMQVQALRKGSADRVPQLSLKPCPATQCMATVSGFAALCAAYEATHHRQRSDHARLRAALSSKPAVSRDPAVVSRHVGKLKRLAARHGLTLAMEPCGPCRWRLRGTTLLLHVADSRLVTRTGGGYEDVLQALARLPA